MKEVLSPTGKPYVGSSKNFNGRAVKHKCDYKLEKRPELIPIAGPYYSRKEAWHAEQPYRVANGWPSEREANSRSGKIGGNKCVESGQHKQYCIAGGIAGGKSNVKNGTGFCNFEARSKACKGKIWINDGMITKKVYPKDFDKWFTNGWSRGRLKRK